MTPFELELGLGAREWDATYIVGGFAAAASSDGSRGPSLSEKLERVKLNRPEAAEDVSDVEDAGTVGSATADGAALEEPSGGQLVAVSGERTLAAHFKSEGAEFLKGRDYQGLEYSAAAGASTKIVQGQHGTASGYTRLSDVGSPEGNSIEGSDAAKGADLKSSSVEDRDENSTVSISGPPCSRCGGDGLCRP